ncbi:unnamed protein product [Microthlaspi erraticum]|uniref:Pentatricopeptide repeat-containing protein n=1 Tax=Microthlaspi erraticum TaxID=1685480 RepID=A0A6D2KHE2_9BRAS|nr:unnamed protein product [Microthlaspi erraticum]
MKEDGPLPNSGAYNTLIRAYLRDGDKAASAELINEMKSCGFCCRCFHLWLESLVTTSHSPLFLSVFLAVIGFSFMQVSPSNFVYLFLKKLEAMISKEELQKAEAMLVDLQMSEINPDTCAP